MIKADKGKVELNGKGAELIAEFAMIYKSLLEKISKEVIMFSLKLAEEAEESKDFIKEKRKEKKPTITKVVIDANSSEEAKKQIDALDIPEKLKNICKKYIDIN